jgi:alkylated DNA repair dioxygenase AlkB
MSILDLITYKPESISKEMADELLHHLQKELAWVHVEQTPRHEYYVNRFEKPYTYGSGRGVRTYQPQPMTSGINAVLNHVHAETSYVYDIVFLNRYLNQSDQLGWHSDNSPEMDDARPIAILSLGVERDILFREMGEKDQTKWARLRLGHGSLCVMPPGFQDTHQHRIPKAGAICGERISLTLRGSFP